MLIVLIAMENNYVIIMSNLRAVKRMMILMMIKNKIPTLKMGLFNHIPLFSYMIILYQYVKVHK